jgi:hypothetical protein
MISAFFWIEAIMGQPVVHFEIGCRAGWKHDRFMEGKIIPRRQLSQPFRIFSRCLRRSTGRWWIADFASAV